MDNIQLCFSIPAQMSALRKVTAAQWSWRGDAGWVDYDAKMNLHVENEYLEGVERIAVDGERFVDVSLPVCESFDARCCVLGGVVGDV